MRKFGPKKTHHLVSMARDMRHAGRTYDEIAGEIGISQDTAHCWTDPEYAARRRNRFAADRQQKRIVVAIEPTLMLPTLPYVPGLSVTKNSKYQMARAA